MSFALSPWGQYYEVSDEVIKILKAQTMEARGCDLPGSDPNMLLKHIHAHGRVWVVLE